MFWFNSSNKARVAVLFCLIVLVVGGGIIAYRMLFAHRAAFSPLLKSSYSGTLTIVICPNTCFSEHMELLVSAQQHLAFLCCFDGEADPDNFTGFIYPDGHLAGTVTRKNGGVGVASWNVS